MTMFQCRNKRASSSRRFVAAPQGDEAKRQASAAEVAILAMGIVGTAAAGGYNTATEDF